MYKYLIFSFIVFSFAGLSGGQGSQGWPKTGMIFTWLLFAAFCLIMAARYFK